MSEREKLIEDLIKLNPLSMRKECEETADFIISDRKRIVEPLVKAYSPNMERVTKINLLSRLTNILNGVEETLKLAGLQKEG